MLRQMHTKVSGQKQKQQERTAWNDLGQEATKQVCGYRSYYPVELWLGAPFRI